jgi:large subunit ribosomal protein L4e
MVIDDLSRIINFDEVLVRPIKKEVKRATMKKNPRKNLNPYTKTARRMALWAEVKRVKAKEEKF